MSKTATRLVMASLMGAAMVSPAIACDMHGGGGWFQVPSSHWQNFTPKASYKDPAFLGDKETEFASTPVPPRPTKPTFSNAADRASKAAKARMAMLDRSSADEEETTPTSSSEATSRSNTSLRSEPNAETIR